MKKQLCQLFKFVKIFRSFWTFRQQYYNKWNRGKNQKFTWNKFSKVFIQISGTYKYYLGHIGTPTNVQNNCRKLCGFGVQITRLFLYPEITRNISCREKFFNPQIHSQDFRTNPTYFFQYLPFYFRLNRPKFTNKIASRVLFYTYITYLKWKTARKWFFENFGWYSFEKMDNYKKYTYFCSNNHFLAI